jgi:hypothetical protein
MQIFHPFPNFKYQIFEFSSIEVFIPLYNWNINDQSDYDYLYIS